MSTVMTIGGGDTFYVLVILLKRKVKKKKNQNRNGIITNSYVMEFSFPGSFFSPDELFYKSLYVTIVTAFDTVKFLIIIKNSGVIKKLKYSIEY